MKQVDQQCESLIVRTCMRVWYRWKVLLLYFALGYFKCFEETCLLLLMRLLSDGCWRSPQGRKISLFIHSDCFQIRCRRPRIKAPTEVRTSLLKCRYLWTLIKWSAIFSFTSFENTYAFNCERITSLKKVLTV